MRYAGFWLRFFAVLIDGIILSIVNFLFIHGRQVPFWLSAIYTIVMLGVWGQTIGKMVMGIKVVDLDGEPIGWGRAIVRPFAEIISGLILGIGFIMAGFTEKKQALHDMLTGTLVVKKNGW